MNPVLGVSVRVELPDCPWVTVNEVGDAEIVKSGPLPVRDAVCGLPLALSATLSVAFLVPNPVGVKVTLRVHFAPWASDAGQVLVWEKSPGFVPVMEMLETFSTAPFVLLFVSVTFCAGLLVPMGSPVKVSLVGERVAEGTTPVPVRDTD